MAAPGDQAPAPPTQEAPRGRKRRAPSWLSGELDSLLDLWEEEEGLHETRSQRRNADIFGRMAQALARQGHPARTLEQVRTKVKELRLGYVRASEGQGAGADTCPHYNRLHAILGQPDPQGPEVPVDSSERPPVTRTTEAGEGDSSASEDEASTVTQQAPSRSPDVSRASSEAGEGSTAGPSRSRGPSSPAAEAPPAGQARRHRLRHRDQLLRRHVQAVERIEASIRQRVAADLQWRQEAWAAFLVQCTRVADSIATLTAHMVHAIHYGMALPHAPAIPPAPAMPPPAMPPPPAAPAKPPPAMPPPPAAPAMPPPPAAPATLPLPAHLPVQPAPRQPALHVQVRRHRASGRGHQSPE